MSTDTRKRQCVFGKLSGEKWVVNDWGRGWVWHQVMPSSCILIKDKWFKNGNKNWAGISGNERTFL